MGSNWQSLLEDKIEMEQVGNTERNSTPLSVIPLISAKTTKCEWCITSHLSHLKLEQLYPPSFSNFMTSNEKVNIVGSYHLRNKKFFSKIITKHSSLSYHHHFLGKILLLKALKPNRWICTQKVFYKMINCIVKRDCTINKCSTISPLLKMLK